MNAGADRVTSLSDGTPVTHDVLIIGGGLSGLAVAAHLDRIGVDWRLLEARERFGGRILSIADPSADTGYDLGPAWIWPHQQRVQQLARDLGVPLHPQYAEGTLVFEDADGAVRRGFAFAPMANTLRVCGGLGRLVDALVARLPQDRLTLNASVASVRPGPEGIAVSLSGDSPVLITARRVVLAVPPRLAASRIDLSTVIDQAGLDAMRRIPTWMAGHGKVLIVYDRPFWRDAGLSGDAISHRGPLMEIHDAGPPDGPGALFGFVHPSIVAAMPNEGDLTRSAIQQLARLFGPDAAAPRGVFSKLWLADAATATDEDARSHEHPQGGLPPAMRAVEQTGLVFAGAEVATDDPGLLEGALAAAASAVDRMGIVPPTRRPDTAPSKA